MARVTKEFRYGIANIPQKMVRLFHLHPSVFGNLVERIRAGINISLDPTDGQGTVEVSAVKSGVLRLTETTTPAGEVGTSVGKVYCKSDNKLYFQDGDGNNHEIQFVS